MTLDQIIRTRILLATQSALLGEVFPGVAAIYVSWDQLLIKLTYFVDEPLLAEDRDSISRIEAEMAAHFPEQEIESSIFNLPFPVPDSCMVCVFARRPKDNK
jgi:hypothetical protein